MKILVLSDTHLKPIINTLIAYEKPDFVIHAGDSQLKSNATDLQQVDKIVKGNCDFEKFPVSEIFKIGNYKVFLTHGHRENVGFGDSDIIEKAQAYDANIIIHGHTHVVRSEIIDNILILNPGSTTNSRCQFSESYFILDLTDQIEVTLKNAYTHEQIKTQSFQI